MENLNGEPLVKDTLISTKFNAATLFDNGYECRAAASNSLVRKAYSIKIKAPLYTTNRSYK